LLCGYPILVPLMALQTIGFIYVAYLSIIQSKNNKNKTSPYLRPSTKYNLQKM